MNIIHAELISNKTVIWFNLDGMDDLPKNITRIIVDDQVYTIINTDCMTSIIGRVNFAVMIDNDKPNHFIGKNATWS